MFLLAVAYVGGLDAADAAADSVSPVLISEILADPHATPDSIGEWFELENRTDLPVELGDWIIRSRNDQPHTIRGPVTLPARGRLVFGRSADRGRNGGVPVAYAYGDALALANGADWLVIAAPNGAASDSVAWRRPIRGVAVGRLPPPDPGAPPLAERHHDADGSQWAPQEAVFGSGDRGTPGSANVAARVLSATPAVAVSEQPPSPLRLGPDIPPQGPRQPRHDDFVALTVQVLDVGQGDAVLITSGRSRVLIDGGPDAARLGTLLDSLELNGASLDLVVVSHAHADHYLGLHALFESARDIRIGRFAENLDHSPNPGLARLRDSVHARMLRDELILLDTDDPCRDGRAVCTFELDGGARLHMLRPWPDATSPNDRSAIVKLVGTDSSGFSMWLAGDSERDALQWMAGAALYGRGPGMDVDVLKANHHGSCNAMDGNYLSRLTPSLVIFSLAAPNDFGFVHTQTTALLRDRGIPWYRTDVNGTITITVPRLGAYSVQPSRGGTGEAGAGDRASTQRACRTM